MSGCVTSTGELRRIDERVDFFEAGRTTFAEISARLGSPTAVYEDGRLAVYIFESGSEQPESALRYPSDAFAVHLVIELDDNDVLQRYRTLVPP